MCIELSFTSRDTYNTCLLPYRGESVGRKLPCAFVAMPVPALHEATNEVDVNVHSSAKACEQWLLDHWDAHRVHAEPWDFTWARLALRAREQAMLQGRARSVQRVQPCSSFVFDRCACVCQWNAQRLFVPDSCRECDMACTVQFAAHTGRGSSEAYELRSDIVGFCCRPQ